MITIGEIKFYKLIENECEVIFDVGCQEDIHYVEMSENKEFHLFEPNLKFYDACKLKLEKLDNKNKIILNNFGLANITQD